MKNNLINITGLILKNKENQRIYKRVSEVIPPPSKQTILEIKMNDLRVLKLEVETICDNLRHYLVDRTVFKAYYPEVLTDEQVEAVKASDLSLTDALKMLNKHISLLNKEYNLVERSIFSNIEKINDEVNQLGQEYEEWSDSLNEGGN